MCLEPRCRNRSRSARLCPKPLSARSIARSSWRKSSKRAPVKTVPPDPTSGDLLPPHFRRWFTARGWAPRAHQLALLKSAKARKDVLLIAPTGAGKTLAGFLPTLVDLDRNKSKRRLHTLYISPLKALATDIA